MVLSPATSTHELNLRLEEISQFFSNLDSDYILIFLVGLWPHYLLFAMFHHHVFLEEHYPFGFKNIFISVQ